MCNVTKVLWRKHSAHQDLTQAFKKQLNFITPIVALKCSPSIISSSFFLTKRRNFGGKLGAAIMEKYAIENMGELCTVEEAELKKSFGDKTGYVIEQKEKGKFSHLLLTP